MKELPLIPFDEWLVWKLAKEGQTQAWLAKTAVVEPANINRYYSGKLEPRLGTMIRILKAFGLGLKVEESVKPRYNARTNWYECGSCHHTMTSGMHYRNELIPAYKVNFCARCGKGVQWNG